MKRRKRGYERHHIHITARGAFVMGTVNAGGLRACLSGFKRTSLQRWSADAEIIKVLRDCASTCKSHAMHLVCVVPVRRRHTIGILASRALPRRGPFAAIACGGAHDSMTVCAPEAS